MKNKDLSRWLSPLSLLAFVLGLVLGLWQPQLFPPIAFLGNIYVNMLKLIVIPLLMTEVACGVYESSHGAGNRLVKTVGLFVVMFVVSFLVTAVLVTLISPGTGLDLFEGEWDGTVAAVSLGAFVESLFPANLFAAMSAGSILPCLIFAFVFGIMAEKAKAKHAMVVMGELRDVLSRILRCIMWLTPLGVFSLMGSAAGSYGTQLLSVFGRYILVAWGCCAVVVVLVMMLPLWVFCRISPLTYLRRLGQIWLITLSTCSSAATLPTTMRVCNEEFGVPESVTSLVVPLGCTIHMCGGAVSFCLLGLFTMQMAGLPVTTPFFLQMLLVATLMNMAAPGIPGGGIVLGATYLTILGAPTGFIGLYSGIYRLLDMAYTTLNVTGDVTANVLLAKAEEKRKKG